MGTRSVLYPSAQEHIDRGGSKPSSRAVKRGSPASSGTPNRSCVHVWYGFSSRATFSTASRYNTGTRTTHTRVIRDHVRVSRIVRTAW
ncbi:hypothetical protein [Amycolatopsis thermophila]|uniref:Uncharacterized protein n=1 Tax=Amycolatopsis thermophila TaxID=206084 RepID=A0ABU0EMI1_9PSEU|nr:hypothetical protein [Amycolatopsis thermophila]MDQ0376389.1 hypothetical protein [Amycolatopsis thermophila]